MISKLENELGGKGIAEWTNPNGGYFVSVQVLDGCAKRVVQLCKEAGVQLTSAGAAYPYGKDPRDSNIRVAPTYPPVSELEIAMDLFCLCTKLQRWKSFWKQNKPVSAKRYIIYVEFVNCDTPGSGSPIGRCRAFFAGFGVGCRNFVDFLKR